MTGVNDPDVPNGPGCFRACLIFGLLISVPLWLWALSWTPW